jgi:predicted nucleotidyltransferase
VTNWLDDFLRHFTRWASTQDSIDAVALIGSHARGAARWDSDIDLIIITSDTDHYVDDGTWTWMFGEVASANREDYSAVQSVRVRYPDYGEIEFGFAAPTWADPEAVDAGTARVVADGMVILIDKAGRLAKLSRVVRQE